MDKLKKLGNGEYSYKGRTMAPYVNPDFTTSEDIWDQIEEFIELVDRGLWP